ncbi:MAG: TIGR03435 family protein [Acidobacteriota bacterium]
MKKVIVPMKKLILWMASLGALCAQDVVGTWQGSVAPNGQSARMVIKITRDNGSLNAALYNIDANPRAVPSSSATLQGSTLNITFIPGRLAYEGRASGDGNSIAGALAQGPNQLTLNLVRATAATAWTIPAPPAPPALMAENARLAFEVATIKPSAPDAQNAPFRVSPERIEILNRSLASLIREAWPLHSSQIIGAKGWMETERWDIVGKPAAPGQANIDQLRQIVRSVLEERFNLKFHMEERELPVYAISMGKTGQHKLRAATVQNPLPLGDTRGAGTYIARNNTIKDLAERLQDSVLDRPVVDRTGIVGRFEFTLEWRPDEFQFGGRAASMPKPPNVDALPDLFTAFQDQLGLKLEALKAPANVFVIDSAQRPSEN